MPKTKTKKPRIDDDEDDFLPISDPMPEPEPVAPVRRAEPGMILDLEGYGGEVASALVVNGLRAYLSVVNKGVNVVATNRPHTAFLPIKIAASPLGLDIKRDEAKPLVEAGGVLAFIVDRGEERTLYYVPVSEYLARAEESGESGLRIPLDRDPAWMKMHEGHPGLRRALAKLLA
jgi:hypothetical protein